MERMKILSLLSALLGLIVSFATGALSQVCPAPQVATDGVLVSYPESDVLLGYDRESEKLFTIYARHYFLSQLSQKTFHTAKGELSYLNVVRVFWDAAAGKLLSVAGPIAPVPFTFPEFFLERAYLSSGADLVLLIDRKASELSGGEESFSAMVLQIFYDAAGLISAVDSLCLSELDENLSPAEYAAWFRSLVPELQDLNYISPGKLYHPVCWNDFRLLVSWYPNCEYTEGQSQQPVANLDEDESDGISADLDPRASLPPLPTPSPTPSPTATGGDIAARNPQEPGSPGNEPGQGGPSQDLDPNEGDAAGEAAAPRSFSFSAARLNRGLCFAFSSENSSACHYELFAKLGKKEAKLLALSAADTVDLCLKRVKALKGKKQSRAVSLYGVLSCGEGKSLRSDELSLKMPSRESGMPFRRWAKGMGKGGI